ncbi:hypothetical protein AVEN_81558-1 [Araneus ventricosus]|uniref:Uncharacterized protein n=1 Tax=Araneus ventricosus TaxID=182803 RepID=A0A4Y2JL77_ARAVE|nr:hypothetical protein AVEN_81558-1 [Araneus ventricosus]
MRDWFKIVWIFSKCPPIVFDRVISQGRFVTTCQLSSSTLCRVPTQVPYHPFNYRMAAAIFIRVMSRHGRVTMRYWMKLPTRHLVKNGGVSVIISKTIEASPGGIRRHPVHSLLVEFSEYMNSLGIQAVLLEPSMLFCAVSSSNKYNLLIKDFNPHDFQGSHKTVTLGIFEDDAKILDATIWVFHFYYYLAFILTLISVNKSALPLVWYGYLQKGCQLGCCLRHLIAVENRVVSEWDVNPFKTDGTSEYIQINSIFKKSVLRGST